MAYDPQIYSSYELNWQLHTQAGNQCLLAGSYLEALQAYRKAIALAELMLMTAKKERRHPETIHAYVTACHNLADNLVKLEDYQVAENTMQQALDQVVDLMHATQYSQCLRIEAAKALKIVSLKVYEFYLRLGQQDKARRVFEQNAELAQMFFSQIQPRLLSV